MTAVVNKQNDESESKNVDEKNQDELIKIKPITFCRKDKRTGVHSCTINGKRIQIADRQLFVAKTQFEIDFFKEDPEVEVYSNKEKNKKKK